MAAMAAVADDRGGASRPPRNRSGKCDSLPLRGGGGGGGGGGRGGSWFAGELGGDGQAFREGRGVEGWRVA